VTIPGCVGIGVATPFPISVEAVFVGGGVLIVDGTSVLKEIGVETVFEVEVASVEDVKLVGSVEDENWVGAGAGSPIASTQYDLPTVRFPQLAVIFGF
jgi:hypothetical protein